MPWTAHVATRWPGSFFLEDFSSSLRERTHLEDRWEMWAQRVSNVIWAFALPIFNFSPKTSPTTSYRHKLGFSCYPCRQSNVVMFARKKSRKCNRQILKHSYVRLPLQLYCLKPDSQIQAVFVSLTCKTFLWGLCFEPTTVTNGRGKC
jgi:hypothetical protein